MKRILILGAGFLQSFLIKKAKTMGYYVLAIDKNPSSEGFQYADESAVVDIVDPIACLNYAKTRAIDGVLTAATDYGVLSAAYVSEELQLPGIPYKTAQLIKNKYDFRRVLFDKQIDDIAQCYLLVNTHDIQEIVKRIKYPVIVKPCDGSGSKGISKVSVQEELVDAFNYALDSSISRKVIVEDFIDGKEYGVESFIYNGDVHVLSVMGKQMTPAPNYAELGHTIPSGLPIDIENKIKDVVTNAIDALGISFGAVNMDILVTSTGKVCIIDIGARMGGNLIGSHIIPFGTGFDYMGALIESAVNDLSSFKPENSPTMIATRLLALKPGKIKILPDFNRIGENYGVTILHHMRAGDVIRPYRTNLDGLGYVYALGDSLEDVEERAEKAKIEIDITTVREV